MNTVDFEKQAGELREKLDRKIQDRAAHQQQVVDQKAAAAKAIQEARQAQRLAAAQAIIARYTSHLLNDNTDESTFSVIMTLSHGEVSVELETIVDRSWDVYSLTDEAVVARIVCDFLSKANLNWVIVPDKPDTYGESTTNCYALRAWQSTHR